MHKSATQAMHGLRTMNKRKKTTSYEEESETMFPTELRYRLPKKIYGQKSTTKQS